MRGSLGDKERLLYIMDSIGSIEGFCKEVDYPTFCSNYVLQLAVVKLLEVIGEASSRLSKELKSEYKETEWSLIVSSRNVLVHAYFAIKNEIVWEAVQNDLPIPKKEVSKILNQKFGL